MALFSTISLFFSTIIFQDVLLGNSNLLANALLSISALYFINSISEYLFFFKFPKLSYHIQNDILMLKIIIPYQKHY